MDPHQIEELMTQALDRLQLKQHVDEHPYVAVAAAAGLGFVLAGGLTTRLAWRVAGLGLRRLALPIALERMVTAKPTQPTTTKKQNKGAQRAEH